LRAFAYIRLSKDDEQTTSYDSQRKAIEALCAARGWTLDEGDVFIERGRSAYNGERRPELERLRKRLREADIVVVLRLDRLARSLTELLKLGGEFQKAGVQLAAVDGEIDTTTATGEAFFNMRGVLAQFEARSLSERMSRMIEAKQSKGEWFGRVPYGWRRPVVGEREGKPVHGKTIEIDPKEFAVLEQAARRYVGGESLRRIAEDIGWHHPNLARTLRTDRVIDALPPGVAAALVEQLGERGRTGTRAKRSLLGGLAKCGQCGHGMTVAGSDARKGWSSYACRDCGHVSISKPWLDAYVSEKVVDAIDRDRLIERIEKQRNRKRGTAAPTEIEARLELLERDYYDGGKMSRASFMRLRDGLFAKLERAKEAAAEGEAVDVPRELAEHLAERWPELGVHTQRRIVAAVAKAIVVAKASSHGPVTPDRVSVEWRV
jgi:DNA invertase Pin-like site-specific DNA recombinase